MAETKKLLSHPQFHQSFFRRKRAYKREKGIEKSKHFPVANYLVSSKICYRGPVTIHLWKIDYEEN